MTQRTNDTKTGSVKTALRFLSVLPSSLFFFFSVFVFPMTETYVGNVNDFTVSFSTLFGSLLLIWGGSAAVLGLLSGLLPRRGRAIASSVLFLLGLIGYIQSNFLNGSMISWTGEKESYSASTVAGNLAVWGAILLVGAGLAVFLLLRRLDGKLFLGVTVISAILLFTQTAGTVYGAVTVDRDGTILLTDEGDLTVASDHNVVVFILDTAAGKYVEEAREQDPDLFDGFDGFTYYPDCLPVYTRTYPSITYYLTGAHCYFDRAASTWINEAADGSTYLSRMYENGIRVGVYTTDPPMVGDALHSYLENSPAGDVPVRYDPFLITRYALSVSAKRVLPYLMKPAVEERLGALNTRAVKEDSALPKSEDDFLIALRENGLTVGEGAGCFRFFHFYGPHPGTRLRPDGTMSGNYTSEPEAVRGDFTIVKAYLEELKRLGLYDKTTVIVTADHGDSRLSTDDYENENKTLDVVRSADMLMLVKPAGATEGFAESAAKISASDLFATVYAGLGLDPAPYGTPIYEIPAGERDRIFYYTALWHDRYGEIARLTFRVTGDSRDIGNYHWTGEYYDIVHSYFGVSSTRFTPSLITAE